MKVKIVATIVKIGNSKGIRLSQKDLSKLDVELGGEIEIIEAKKIKHQPNQKKALEALQRIAERGGPLTQIDVEQWMEERRAQYKKREDEWCDIPRL